MNESDVLLGLHETQGIGWMTIHRLKELVPSLAVLPKLGEKEIRALPFPPEGGGRAFPEAKKIRIFQGTRPQHIAERKQRLRQAGYSFVTCADPHYPAWLSHIQGAPWVLYYAGNYDLLKQPVISVVGTRVPTAYGKRIARQLSAELSHAGWHIASGLARGIDSEAHIGALEGRGKTIAVLGSPVNHPYPRENTRLYEQICAEGIVVSEYPIGTPIKKGMFPERNRILAGISMGTVVVEADIGSGSLITAYLALAQGREVFAVPGPISSPKSAGTLDLIKKSAAKLITGIEDIYEEFEARDPEFCKKFPKEEAENTAVNTLTADERKVVSLLGDLPVTFDQLYERTQFDFGHLHSVLLSLLMKKMIEQQPGSSYILLY